MDPTENNSIPDDDNSEEQQGQSEGAESNVRPSLSQVKKSWGFRRTTIARREFLDEVGDLNHSPPHARRARNRRTNQPPPETCTNQGATCTTKSVIDDLEWSAPSSPVSEESKPASETSARGSLDPSLWQDFGSAFHTAFSLLGGSEGLSMDVSDALAAPDILQATGGIEASMAQAVDEPEVSENMEPADDMEISQPVAPSNVAADVVLISSQEEDSDNMTLIQIKEQLASKGKQGARGGKGGRGKARGRGRGRGKARGKGRGRGRGRGRAVELQSTIVAGEDSDDDVMLVNPSELQLQEEEKLNDSPSPAEIETSPAHSDVSLSPAQRSSSDCIIIDSDLDQITYATPGQYDDAPEEEEEGEGGEKEKKDDKNEAENSGILDTEGYDSNALYCICRQKHNKRFMICCDSCQEWFHGNCVGISQTQGRQMERKGQEYICPRCTAKNQRELQPEFEPEPEPEPELQPELSFPERLTQSPPGEEGEGREKEQALKETAVVVEKEQAAVTRPEPEPDAEMETDSSLPLCIGPQCSKQALPDSVYCGTECILQHAAVTIKTLSGPKVPKSKGRMQRKAATARPTIKGQRSGRMSKRLAGKAEEEGEEEEMKEDDGGQKEASSPLACDPRLTEVQATSIPSSQFYTASKEDSKHVDPESEAVTPSKQLPEDTSADAAPSVQPTTEPEPPQSVSQEKTKKPVHSGVSKQPSVESEPSVPLNQAKSSLSSAAQSPSSSAPRHHETGALMVTKTSYVIPKKQSGPQTQSGKVSVATSSQKPSTAPSLLNETRNLPVPPAPSAPSSRPSQPNNQVRQSIQRSLTSILFKRVCDCEDLKMPEIEVTKLVANIEMEMFDIFRNTDSKYMNKYRTIMFNLKDPKNKGLLYRVIRGEISPFRLARMSQKDMQAIKASEPSPKENMEVKDAANKVTSLLQKPEAVKVDLPSLNPVRRDRSMEQKKTLPASTLKTRTSQPSQDSAVPDVLACMLKDTTSEHKAHLFDLKCKICTGQILAGDEEPAKKKSKVSETRDKHEPSWRKPAGDDSPLRAPPDSPDMDSPTSRLIIDSPVLTIVESPASPVTDSPASPTLESPASPVMQSPASPTPDTPKSSVSKRAYTPVVIPAVSTVSITRRDPRTAASRFSASSTSTSGPTNITQNQSAPYAPLKETRSASPPAPTSSLPPTKSLPKSILMKPSSADPRLYGTSSRTVISQSPADGETAQFIAKQDILWKGFLNMLSVAKFVTKGYLVSGSAENLKADLPDTIQIGGRIMPETVWDYVAKLKTSVTKELCVIRFHPATEEEEVAYVSLFSYFSSRGRFGVVANSSRSIKDVYLVPLSAKEPIPSILQPLEGPGLEKNRPNLLLGLAIIQKAKRPGNLPLEIEEKKPKVHMAKDPMWIPKPPVLYGSDKLEIFQPYDPETPASTTPPSSPACPGSPSESSSSSSVTIPSLLTSIRADSPVSTSASGSVVQSTPINISDKNLTTASSDKTPLQTILKTLFSNKQTDSTDGSTTTTTTTTGSDKKLPVFSQVSGSMVDPIVQQYGQKSKVKEIEEEENDFDRPYDPEEEYDPAVGYGMVASQTMEKNKAVGTVISGFVDDDVAYDPEDESIFADIQSDIVTKPPVPTQASDSPSCPTLITTQAVTPAPTSTPVPTSTSAEVTQTVPTGTVVVSAATLTEQQRMLEELNKQIEEQKRQLKEQEEALRQQREAVGMFMAHFSVSDSLMSPPSKSLPLSQLPSLPSGIMQTESKPSESMDKSSNKTENVAHSNVDLQTVKPEDTTGLHNLKSDTVTEQDETQENVKDSEKYSSAGEIEDSDVAYDPEDESLFNEIQDDVFQGSGIKTCDLSWSRTGHSASHKGTQNSHHSRKRRLSPKRRSHRERDRHRSPSRKSQRRSPSHSQRRRERERHRKSERDRSRHRTRDQSERQGRHRKEHSTRRHSRGRRRSSLSPRKNDSVSLSPKPHRGPSPEDLEKSSTLDIIKNDPDGHQLKCNLVESPDKDFSYCSHELLKNVKLEILEHPNSVSDNTSGGCSTQVDKNSLQETLLTDKLDSTIPLREIDPPIRDSPQSPDPEPQFAKLSSTEKSDFKSEEIRNPETHTSVSLLPVKVENNTIHQGTVPNILWPGGPISDVRNLDFRALAQQDSSVRDQCMIEANKQIESEGPGLGHPEILGQGGGHYSPATGLVTKCPGPGNSGPDVKEHGKSGPQMYPRGTGIRFPGPDMRGPSPNIWVPGPHIDLAVSGQGKHGGNAGTAMQGEEAVMREAGIQHCSSDIIGSGPVMSGSGMRSPVQDRESPRMQGVNPEVKGLCPDIKDSNPEMRGQMLVPAVRESLMRRSTLQNERRDTSLRGPLSDRLGSDGPDMRSTGPFGGSEKVQRQSRHIGSPVLDEGGTWKRGFQPHERDADLSRVGERGFDTNVFTGSEGIVLRADRPSPAMTDDRRGPQRGQDVPMRRPGPNTISESGGPRVHLKEPQPGQDVGRRRGSDNSGDRSESHSRSSGRDTGETGPNRRNPDMEGRNMQGIWLQKRNEQMDPEDRGPMPNITNPDWRSPGPGLVGPDMRAQRSQNKGRGRHMRDQNWNGPELDVGDGWRGPDRGTSGSLRGGPVMQDEWRVHQPDRRSQNIESQVPDRQSIGDQNFREMRPEMSPNTEHLGHDRRGPGGQHFMGPQHERRGSEIDTPIHDRRGPERPNFMGPGYERRGSEMEVPMHDRRGPGGPDFRRPEPENVQGPGTDFSEPGSERRALSMEGPGPPWGGPGGPDFREPGRERRGPIMEGPVIDRRGPRGPDFRGLAPERRGPAMEGPGPDRRGPGGPDFRGPGPEGRGLSIEGPGPDRRGPGCPDFRGPGPESRGLSVEGLGPDRKGPGGPHFRGPGPDRRGPGGPDFRGPGPEWRHLPIEAPGPDRRGPGGPDISVPGSDRRGPAIGDLVCERRGPFIQDQGPDRRGPGDQITGGFGPDSRAPYTRGPEPDFIEVGPERSGPGMDYSGPHDRGQGGPHFRGPGPRSGHPDMEGAWPDKEGPEIRPRPERPVSCMEGPRPNRGPGGPNMRRPVPQNSGQNMESPGLDRRCPEGPNFRGPGPERRPPDMDGTGNSRSFPGGLQLRGPEPERRPPDMEHPGSDRRGPHLRGMRPERTVIDGPGSERKSLRGPDLRGSVFESRGPQIEGPGLDRQEPEGLSFREPVPERRGPEMEGPRSDWRRSGGPDFRGPGIRQKGPNTEVPRNRRDDWGDDDFGGLGPVQERPDIEGPGSDRSGQNMRGLGPLRRNISGPGSNMNQGEEWEGPDFSGSEHVRRGTDEQWSDGRGPYMEAVRNERECPEDSWERHGNRGPGPISEGPDKQAREHSRQGPHMGRRGRGSRGSRHMQERPHMLLRGPGDDWAGPGCRGPRPVQDDPDMVYPGPDRGEPGNEWREPDTGSDGPNRWGCGPLFRGERDQDNRGHDRRGPGMRGLGSDRQWGADMGNDWREPEFSDSMRGPNIDRHGFHREDLINSYPNRRGFEMEGLDRRGPGSSGPLDIEGPGRRFPDCGGLGTERPGADMESAGTGRQGFEHDYRRERRGPDMRRPGHGKIDMRGPAPPSPDIRHGPGWWDTNTEGQVLDLGVSEPASFHFNGPHQATRYQGPSDSHSAHYIGPLGSAQNSGGNSCPGFDNLQNRQAVKPQRHRTALLPTPTEGLIRFPNHVINNPDVFSPKRKQIGHQKDREWSRGRPVSRERELAKGQRQDQEKSRAGKISTPIDAGKGGREEKKQEENENNKAGNPDVYLETKTNQNVDSDANKSSIKPS